MKKLVVTSIILSAVALVTTTLSLSSVSLASEPTVNISVAKLEKMEKQIASLKRVQEALIQMDSETWNNVAEIIEKQDGIVFPRTDHICPDTMVHVKLNGGTGAALLANTCEMEADLWESE